MAFPLILTRNRIERKSLIGPTQLPTLIPQVYVSLAFHKTPFEFWVKFEKQ